MPPFTRHPLSEFMDRVDCLRPLEVERAPQSVGLYAWYGQISFSQKDWELELANGSDVGEKGCRALLQRHTSRYASPQMKLEGRSTFSTSWRGILDDATIDRLRMIISGEGPLNQVEWYAREEDSQRFEKFQYVMGRSNLRGALLQTIKMCTPFIASPIYIGVAANLRERLKTHVDQLFRFSELIGKRPEERQKLLQYEKTTFASRAIAMGFNEDTVAVWTVDLGKVFTEVSREDLRSVAEATEWLLNRWHKPLLGRR